jgi:hypothetical protein
MRFGGRGAAAPALVGSLLLSGAPTASGQRPESTTSWAPERPAGNPVAPLAPLPPSALTLRTPEGWRRFWESASAPQRWSGADSLVAAAVRWRRVADGVDWSELELTGSGEAWRTRLVVVRLDPSRVRLVLDTAYGSGRAAWTIDRAPDAAVVAVNGGQFVSAMPWGWVVLEGRQLLSPGTGPLVTTLTLDDAGIPHWSHGGRIEDARRRAARWAFQSYPTLLRAGEVPPPLRGSGGGLDVAHRDARLAIGGLDDGRLLVAMTRFDAFGRALGFVPFGLTTPEMAAVMGALGARDAVLLDGGISAQLLLRSAKGATHRFTGLRPVPLALLALPRR